MPFLYGALGNIVTQIVTYIPFRLTWDNYKTTQAYINDNTNTNKAWPYDMVVAYNFISQSSIDSLLNIWPLLTSKNFTTAGFVVARFFVSIVNYKAPSTFSGRSTQWVTINWVWLKPPLSTVVSQARYDSLNLTIFTHSFTPFTLIRKFKIYYN